MTQINRNKHTIHDIARLAGVGAGTVSRVLNDRPNVSQATRDRVLRAIEKLDYRPSFSARHLRTRRSHLIGFITDEVATAPYAGDIIRGAQERAWADERFLLVINVGADLGMAQAAVDTMLERQVEGIIYAAMFHRAVTLPDNIHKTITVLANCYATDRSLPSVVPDERSGGRVATQALLQAGHQRVGLINVNTLQSEMPAALGRYQGYQDALAQAGIPLDERIVRHGDGSPELGYRYANELMAEPRPPTAIFCGTDRTALGAYDALREHSLRIPEDVAVIGFDNQEIIASALRPPLTTMQLPHYQMGQWAVDYLTQHMHNHHQPPADQQLLPCPLVPRASIQYKVRE